MGARTDVVELGRRWVRHPLARLAALPVVAFAVVLREPSLFESPRFWAEEGTNYYGSAVSRGALAGLLNVRAAPYNPYLHAIPQLSTVAAAHLAPLELAPAVTTFTWAFVVLSVELVALYSRAAFLEPPWRRALAVAAPLLAASGSENWANTLGAHFFCDYALVLLLLEAARVAGARKAVSVAAFGALSVLSPTSWFLLPAAIVLALRDFKTHRAYLVGLGTAVAANGVVSLTCFDSHSRGVPDLVAAPHILVEKFLLWPLAGWRAASEYSTWALGLERAALARFALALALGLVALIAVFVRFGKRDATTFVLLSSYGTAVAGYLLLGIGVGRDHLPLINASRYTWLPNALLFLILAAPLGFGDHAGNKPFRALSAVVLGAALVVGVAGYRFPEPVLRFSLAPSWRAEVRHHRRDPNYGALRIAPAGWVVLVPAEK